MVVGTLLTAISAASAAVDRPLCTLRRQHSTHNSLDWRKDAMRSVRDECERAASTRAYDCGDRDVYEFGVYGGKSIKSLLFYFNCSGIPLRRFWAFDSFRGLPDEDRRNFSAGVERMYGSGQYSAAAALKRTGQPLLDRIELYVGRDRMRHYGVQWISGFYNESLTPSLQRERAMRPALYVDIDADLYTSTTQALEWLVANGLIVSGTIIGYDDWSVSDRANGGEKRAHEEVIEQRLGRRYKVSRTEGCGPNAACFRIT